MKKAFWFAQRNHYDLIYVTTYEEQESLIDHLEYYGFHHTHDNDNGERVYEKVVARTPIAPVDGESRFDSHRLQYPRFVATNDAEAFGIPIKEGYHDVLYPDLRQSAQLDLFGSQGPKRPGNTIRKVYLCRAQSNLGLPGSLLFFYKGKSELKPSQAITAIGILEDVKMARSTNELLRMTSRRSVYSEKDLEDWGATVERPVKVINYLLAAYIDPAISLAALRNMGVVKTHPPQSIFRIQPEHMRSLLALTDLGFTP